MLQQGPAPAAKARVPIAGPKPGTDYSAVLQAVQQASMPLDTAPLLRQAHTQALADVAAQTAGIRAQQAEIQRQAAQRAQGITGASDAAAKFESGLNLGGSLSDSLRQAGLDQAGLAAGYSGQLQTDVANASAPVAKALSTIGSAPLPASSASQAANVVYGVGGKLPADALLQAAPLVEAEANRVPASLAAYGVQEAQGTLGAGAQQSNALTPQITAATAKLPGLETGYASQLTSAAEKQRQNGISNALSLLRDTKPGAAKTYSSGGYEYSIGPDGTVTQLPGGPAPAKQPGVHYYSSGGLEYALDPSTGKVTQLPGTASASSRAPGLHYYSQGGREYAFDPNTGKTSQLPGQGTKAAAPKINTTASGRYGIQIDTSGNPILRNGTTVSYPKTTGGASSTSGARTQKLIATIDAGLDNAATGFDAKDINGKVVHHPALDRAGAMQELEQHGYFATPDLKKLAMSRLNKIFPPQRTVHSSGPFGVTAATAAG